MPTDETFNAHEIVEDIHDWCDGMEIRNTDKIVVAAVEQTLAYVVEWLYERGDTGPADILESIGEL